MLGFWSEQCDDETFSRLGHKLSGRCPGLVWAITEPMHLRAVVSTVLGPSAKCPAWDKGMRLMSDFVGIRRVCRPGTSA